MTNSRWPRDRRPTTSRASARSSYRPSMTSDASLPAATASYSRRSSRWPTNTTGTGQFSSPAAALSATSSPLGAIETLTIASAPALTSLSIERRTGESGSTAPPGTRGNLTTAIRPAKSPSFWPSLETASRAATPRGPVGCGHHRGKASSRLPATSNRVAVGKNC